MENENNSAIFQAYEEATIEIFHSQNQLEDSGWNEYFVITSWNPFSRELSLTENRERNIALKKELFEAGAEILNAVGRSSDWKWVEESFAVKSVSQNEIIHIATKYEQNAIFHISSGVRKVLSCIN